MERDLFGVDDGEARSEGDESEQSPDEEPVDLSALRCICGAMRLWVCLCSRRAALWRDL
jgi:hypothetical protein